MLRYIQRKISTNDCFLCELSLSGWSESLEVQVTAADEVGVIAQVKQWNDDETMFPWSSISYLNEIDC